MVNGIDYTPEFHEAEADKIFSQAGLNVEFLRPAPYTDTSFLNLDAASFLEEDNLFEPGHGQHPDPNVINVWYIHTIYLGSDDSFPAVSSRLEKGVAVAKRNFTDNLIDHQTFSLGVTLGLSPDTSGDPLNLMAPRSIREIPQSIDEIFPDGMRTDQLRQEQIHAMLTSRFVTPKEVSLFPTSLAELELSSPSVCNRDGYLARERYHPCSGWEPWRGRRS